MLRARISKQRFDSRRPFAVAALFSLFGCGRSNVTAPAEPPTIIVNVEPTPVNIIVPPNEEPGGQEVPVSLCGDPTEISLDQEHRYTIDQVKKLILTDSLLLEFVSASQSNDAIFRIVDHDGNVLSTFTVRADTDYTITINGEAILTFAVCSVNSSYDFSERSATIATDRELETYEEPVVPPVTPEPVACEDETSLDCSENLTDFPFDGIIRGEIPFSDFESGRNFVQIVGVTREEVDGVTTTNYTMQFRTNDGQNGLPICSFAAPCLRLDRTENHGIFINFLDGLFRLVELKYNRVTLHRDIAGGIINVSASLILPNNWEIRLDSISSSADGLTLANVSILDQNGDLQGSDTLFEGINFISAGCVPIKLRIDKLVSGSIPGARWADMSVVGQEIQIQGVQIGPYGVFESGTKQFGIWQGWSVNLEFNSEGTELLGIVLSTQSPNPQIPVCE